MPTDWRADEDSIIFPHQGGFRQVGDLWAQVLISFFFDTVAVAVRVGIVGLGGFNPVEIRSGQFRNLFRQRFGIARCGEINNQRFSRILSGSADNRQPFCLQQRVQLFTYDATTYLNESMQQIYRLTPHSRHIPSTLPEDLDPGDITTPGRADDEGIDMPGNAAGVKTWLKRIGMLP